MKTCGACRLVKPLAEFARRGRDGHQSWCRPCANAWRREHYGKNREREAARNRQADRSRREVVRTRALEFLAGHPCVDCGEADPVLLEFDHRDRSVKDRCIAEMMKDHSWPKILEEIEKCDVRCANCHRRKTAREFGFYRANALLA